MNDHICYVITSIIFQSLFISKHNNTIKIKERDDSEKFFPVYEIPSPGPNIWCVRQHPRPHLSICKDLLKSLTGIDGEWKQRNEKECKELQINPNGDSFQDQAELRWGVRLYRPAWGTLSSTFSLSIFLCFFIYMFRNSKCREERTYSSLLRVQEEGRDGKMEGT